MSFVCLVIESELQVSLLDHVPGDSISISGRSFIKRANEDIVFYDWIADDTAIQALDIHLDSKHPLLINRVPLPHTSYIDTNCFVQIWLGKSRCGHPLGKEAFGDLFFYVSKDSTLAIIVGIQEWLSPQEQGLLLNMLHK